MKSSRVVTEDRFVGRKKTIIIKWATMQIDNRSTKKMSIGYCMAQQMPLLFNTTNNFRNVCPSYGCFGQIP